MQIRHLLPPVASALAALAPALGSATLATPAHAQASVERAQGTAVKTIEPGFSVAPQITPADVPVLAAAGIKTIVNNRPDNEAPGQPSGAAIEAAARAHGLEYVHLPVVSGKLEDKDAAALAKVLEASKGPVLAFCRSGSRTTALWALSQAGHRPPDELIRKAAAAGYDLRPLIPRLQSRVTQR